MGRIITNIVLPSTDKVLNSVEEDLFQADDHPSEVSLQHLDGLVERASSGSQMKGINIDKMATTLWSWLVRNNASGPWVKGPTTPAPTTLFPW